MVTDAAVTSRHVLTATVGAGRLATLIDVCTQAVEKAEARAAGHTAVRPHRVHTLLTRTQQRVLTLVDVCAGVSSELVSAVTDTPEAAWGVLTATVGATGAVCALVDVVAGGVERVGLVSAVTQTAVPPHWLIHTQAPPTHTWPGLARPRSTMDSRGPRGGGGRAFRCRRGDRTLGRHGNRAFSCGGGGAFGRRVDRTPGAGQRVSSSRLLGSRRRASASLFWSWPWFKLSLCRKGDRGLGRLRGGRSITGSVWSLRRRGSAGNGLRSEPGLWRTRFPWFSWTRSAAGLRGTGSTVGDSRSRTRA